MPEMWGGRADSGSHSVPLWEGQKRTKGKRDALASKKWVRMEDSGRVDDEGRPILERVDLMEASSRASTVRSKNHVCRRVRFSEVRISEVGGGGACTYRCSSFILGLGPHRYILHASNENKKKIKKKA